MTSSSELAPAIQPRAFAIDPELVPSAFRERVALELRWARMRSLELMPLAVETHVRRGSRWDPEQTQIVRRTKGRCVGCNAAHDARTPGCGNCGARHAMRRRGRQALDAAAEIVYDRAA